MKALVYTGPKQAEFMDVEDAKAQEGKVKVDVTYCGVCGSDIGIYLGTHPRAKAPLILGHEFLGIVAEDGEKVKKGMTELFLIHSYLADIARRAEMEMNMYVIVLG